MEGMLMLLCSAIAEARAPGPQAWRAPPAPPWNWLCQATGGVLLWGEDAKQLKGLPNPA
ncbi:hypothetical protein GmRootA79_48340 [Acidovorax sp. A79]